MTIDLTCNGIEGRIARLCFSIARPKFWGLLRPIKLWRI